MNIYVDKYVDEKGNADNQLSLNSDGYSYLTEDLEEIISKYSGILITKFNHSELSD